MTGPGSICKIGIYYDGSYFSYAQNYFYHDRRLGWLQFPEFHQLIETYISREEAGFSSYKVVYASWHQGMFAAKGATEGQLRRQRNLDHELMHAGIGVHYSPMSERSPEKGTSEKAREKGVDVALAIDALEIGLEKKVDVAVLVTGDGDFVPLVRALSKQGVRVLTAYFHFEAQNGIKSFGNPRLLAAANWELDINSLESEKEFSQDFQKMFRKRIDEGNDNDSLTDS